MLEYHAAYYPIEDGWYMVRVLDFPGTITQGKNLEDARLMVRDALKLMAECTLERGEPLPRPNPRARDKKAERIEPLCLNVRISTARPNEKKKTAPAPSSA
jgi:predicted RNase H-like HicB family nuclease